MSAYIILLHIAYRSLLVNAQVRFNRDKKVGQKGGHSQDPDIWEVGPQSQDILEK